MTDPVILLGTQSNGETLPVQVNDFGQLVAEGIQGSEGPPGPPGEPGADGGDFPLPPDPENGDVLGWQDDQLQWISGIDPQPPLDGVLVATTFDDGTTSINGGEFSGYSGYGVCTPPDGFIGYFCVAFTIQDQSAYSGVFVRNAGGSYRTQDAKDQTLCSSIGTMNRDPDWRTLSAYQSFAEVNGVTEGKTAIPVDIRKDLESGMYMWVVDCYRKQLFIGEMFGQGRWVDNKQPGMTEGLAALSTSGIQICLSPYTAIMTVQDVPPPPIVTQKYFPRARHYNYERDRGQIVRRVINGRLVEG